MTQRHQVFIRSISRGHPGDDIELGPAFSRRPRCPETDPEIFFPEKGHPEQVKYAKAICGRCAAQPECLQYALDNGEQWGIWGGMTGRELGRARRKAGITP